MALENTNKLMRSPKLSEQIAQLLSNDIQSGALRPGENFPSEADLCARFDVSRTVIREAMGRLEHDGFIEAKQGCRTVVASLHHRRAFRIDQLNPMSIDDISQLYELRLIIESAAASLAAKRADKKIQGKMLQCVQKMEAQGENMEHGIPMNVRFHQLIAEASANDYLMNFMVFLNDKLSYLSLIDSKQITKEGSLATIHDEHKAICKAIAGKDESGAREAIQRHIINAAKRHSVKLEPIL